MSTLAVSPASIFFMCITLLVCFGLPVALAIWGKAKYKKAFTFLPLLGGVLGFFISQVVFRFSMLYYVLPLFGWFKQLMNMQWLYLIFMCFTASLVEEPARFIVFSIMKKHRGFPDGLSYGIGHGGIEAILLVGLTYIGNLVLAITINSGNAGSLALLPAATLTALTSTAPYMFLVAGIERVFAISLHIALSFVVLRGFQTNRKLLYLVASFLLHGSANLAAIAAGKLGATVMADSQTLGSVIFSEGALLIIAVLSVFYIVRQARDWRKATMKEEPLEQPR